MAKTPSRSPTIALLALVLFAPPHAAAQPGGGDDDRQARAIERFMTLLERNPRKGTALDRVYGHHVERGTVEEFVASFAEQARQVNDGGAWMIVGMLEYQRGREAAAVEAFERAEALKPDDPLASYYLGQSLAMVGRIDDAAAAYERALKRSPNRADMLEIYQELGRIYQRALQNEKALDVWDRLEKQFPGDERVQAEIAAVLAEEGRHQQALDRYDKLAKTADDEYRQVSHALKAAELQRRLGRPKAALERYERLLAALNPTSWLHADVRQHIEDVFLRSDDYAGLTTYYERWLQQHPSDIQAMTRAGRALASQGRYAESRSWYEKALTLAPSDVDLRLALIDMHVATKDFSAAAAQYARLDEYDPANPDHLREWGEVLLKDTTLSEQKRRDSAADVWRRMLEGKSSDPATVVQLADLFRQARMTDEALELYRRGVELAPEDPAYREYLGEYYHSLKRKADALRTWAQIAAGANRNSHTLVRLAEILHQNRYLKEAIATLQEADQLGLEFADQLRLAQLLREDEQTTAALEVLDKAAGLPQTPEEEELLLEERIHSLLQADRLTREIEVLQQQIEAAEHPTAEQSYRLARYHEANSDRRGAALAIQQAMKTNNRSPVIWQTAVRILESSGRFSDAADAGRQLAQLDVRYRTEHLKNVASLEVRLGRAEEALSAAQEVVAGAPGNPGHYRFLADLCFQLGKTEEAFDALRRAVRVNPSDPQALESLAQALGEHYRTDEAIELYWRVFESASALGEKLGAIERLAPLYLRTNQFDRLTDRLGRLSRESESQRDATICLAQAHRSAGNPGAARRQLETLLSEDRRDPVLLEQLVKICEAEGDVDRAINYQRRLNEMAPDERGAQHLADLYSQIGDDENATGVLLEYASSADDPKQLLAAVDSLLVNRRYNDALPITQRLVRERPRDWQVLYRHAVVLNGLTRRDDAQQHFAALIDLAPSDGETASATTGASPGTTFSTRSGVTAYRENPIYSQLSSVGPIRQLVGLDQNRNQRAGSRRLWSPQTLGESRLAAMAFLYVIKRTQDAAESFIQEHKPDPERILDNKRAAWDWFYLQYVLLDYPEAYEIAKALSQELEPRACFAYLSILPQRRYQPTDSRRRAAFMPPARYLGQDELDHVLKCLKVAQESYPHATNGYLTGHVIAELERGRRNDEAAQLYESAIAAAERYNTTPMWLNFVASRGDMETFVQLQQRQIRLGRAGTSAANQHTLVPLMHKRASRNGHADILVLLDMQLQILRQQASTRRRSASYRPPQLVSNRGRGYAQVYQNRNWRGVQFDYPTPGVYFDQNAITLLRNVYEIFKRDDLLTDLTGHLRRKLKDTTEEAAIYAALPLAYIAWWEGEQDVASRTLEQAVDAAPGSFQIRLELADLRRQMGQLDEALELLDEVEPADHADFQRREALALQLAASIGDKTRARQAAQHLFGFRMDANSQMQLANFMRQLGLNDMARSVLDRVRQQSGNQSGTLVSLMRQYQQQGDDEIAAEIAYQILRRESVGSMSVNRRNSRSARQQAIAILASSGRLQQLTGRVEAQLEGSPDSMRLIRTLADYYAAARDYQRSREMYARAIQLRPDDTRWRFQIASDMADAGDHSGAVDQYLHVFRQDTSLLGRNDHYEVQRTFQQARRLSELAKVLSESDLSKLPDPFIVTNLVQQLAGGDRDWKSQAVSLIRKAWQTFPDRRHQIVRNIYRPELWQLPEMLDFAVEAIIPAPGQKNVNPWLGLDSIFRHDGDGRATGLVTHLLQRLDSPEEVAKLRVRVTGGVDHFPGGKLLLAVLESRLGNSDAAEKLVRDVLAQQDHPIPVNAAWLIGQELESDERLSDVTVELYQQVLDSTVEQQSSWWRTGFAGRITDLFVKLERQSQARRLLMRAYQSRNSSFQSAASDSRLLQDAERTAGRFIDIGFPVDAIRIYNDMTSGVDPAVFQTNSPYAGGGALFRMTVESGLSRARHALDKSTLRRMLLETVDPAAAEVRRAGTPPVDLVMVVQSQDLRSAQIINLFYEALELFRDDKQVLEQIEAHLDELEKTFPDDLSIHVARALIASAGQNRETFGVALSRLQELLAANPLDELADSSRPNARQRREAADRLVLWPAVKAAWRYQATSSIGDALGEHALVAARRQFDRNWVLAMLRVRGARALEAGDVGAAEKYWSEMLDIVSSQPDANAAGSAATDPGLPRSVGAGGNSPRRPVDDQRRQPPDHQDRPRKLDSYRRLIQIAKLAADNGMHELSLRSVRTALAGGPPMQSATNSNLAAGVGTSAADQEVEADLFVLHQFWLRGGARPQDVFAVLRDVVLPAGRPKNVFLYPAPTIRTGVDRPRSVARLLAETAATAELGSTFVTTVDDARKRSNATLEPELLLGQFAIATRNPELCDKAFSKLEEWLERVVDPTTAEIISHAAVTALFDSQLTDLGDRLLSRVTSNLIDAKREEPLGALLLLSARALFQQGDSAGALRRIERYESFFSQQNAKLFGNFAKLRQKEQLNRVIAELTRAGQVAHALERLATLESIQTVGVQHQAPAGLEASLLRQLAAMTPERSFDILVAWTFPPKQPDAVRTLSAFIPFQRPPVAAGGVAAETTLEAPLPDYLSTAQLLVAAAHSLGRVGVLKTQLAARNKQTPGHQLVSLEIAVAQNNREQLQALVADERIASWTKSAEPRPDIAYALAELCLRDSDSTAIGEKILRTMLNGADARHDDEWRARLQIALQQTGSAPAAGANLLASDVWLPAMHLTANAHAAGRPAATWLRQDQTIRHAGGPELQYLFLAYPLSGEFRFSVETQDVPGGEGHLSYDGLTFEILGRSGHGSIWKSGRNMVASNRCPALVHGEFNTLSVESSGKAFRYFVNGELYYEQSAGKQHSPWVALFADRGRRAKFRNLELTGTPEILREVSLSDSLNGWLSNFYGETQPPASLAATAAVLPDPIATDVREDHDWAAVDGIIYGRRSSIDSLSGSVQSRLYYQRPLREGESLSYEFFYVPGAVEVHPAIGRTCFLLQSDGLLLHWITDGDDKEWSGMRSGNSVAAQNSKPLALKPYEWNKLQIGLEGENATLKVNGNQVHSQPLDAADSRLFSLFHFKDRTSAEVRNVVLRGNWPDELDPVEIVQGFRD